ncbi:MAG TPA: TetR/AcrR family transcriptional regulator [Acidimicrobiales bacterium]|nr:TetR/AcrR family transcriptional regulator [Acidimicrobiales bacterium]
MTLSKGAVTRNAILRAAIARFARDGFRATSVADIAREAAVSGTLVYAYFPNKEALFLAAVDEDSSGLIQLAVDYISSLEDLHGFDWRATLLLTLVDAVDDHPLAKRLLAGLEPDVTGRVLEMPALEELRKVVGERLRRDQLSGSIRSDIDPFEVGIGLVSIFLSLLMSVTQIGRDAVLTYSRGIVAVTEAAILPVKPPAPVEKRKG